VKEVHKSWGGGGGDGDLDAAYTGPSEEDLRWLTAQLDRNGVRDVPQSEDEWHRMRKGINPRTRQQQLSDLRK
jgi:hypothetical protein